MTSNFYGGMDVIKNPYVPKGKMFVTGSTIIIGPPPVSREIYEIFHQGDMLKWYDYIGEGPNSLHDLLFGYR